MYKKIYSTRPLRKELIWIGSSRASLAEFPTSVRQVAGKQLSYVRAGEVPGDFKIMNGIGPGAFEIRIRDESGQFRIIYVAKFLGVIAVLHCFQKKTEESSRRDMEIAKARYKEFLHGYKDLE